MESFFTEIYPDPLERSDHLWRGRFFLELLETVILSLVLFLGINAVSARIRVESISMQPTLYENDFVFVNKVAYQLGSPKRGDIVVFRYPRNPEGEPYIKRVIGLPGDEVNITGGVVYINGAPLHETYLKAAPAYSGTWRVPQNALFVLGDNRNSSSDSHSWGMVPYYYVIGKAEAVYLPVKHWQILNQPSAAAAEP